LTGTDAAAAILVGIIVVIILAAIAIPRPKLPDDPWWDAERPADEDESDGSPTRFT
jgi:hypothetical protein